MVIAAFAAPLGWAVVVGTSARVGILRSTRIRQMGPDTAELELVGDDVSLLVARLGVPRPSVRETSEPPERADAVQPNFARLVHAREGTRAPKRPR